jgi:hypothetical protein
MKLFPAWVAQPRERGVGTRVSSGNNSTKVTPDKDELALHHIVRNRAPVQSSISLDGGAFSAIETEPIPPLAKPARPNNRQVRQPLAF